MNTDSVRSVCVGSDSADGAGGWGASCRLPVARNFLATCSQRYDPARYHLANQAPSQDPQPNEYSYLTECLQSKSGRQHIAFRNEPKKVSVFTGNKNAVSETCTRIPHCARCTETSPSIDIERSFRDRALCRPIVSVSTREILEKTTERSNKLQSLVKRIVEAREKEKQTEAWNNYINELKNKNQDTITTQYGDEIEWKPSRQSCYVKRNSTNPYLSSTYKIPSDPFQSTMIHSQFEEEIECFRTNYVSNSCWSMERPTSTGSSGYMYRNETHTYPISSQARFKYGESAADKQPPVQPLIQPPITVPVPVPEEKLKPPQPVPEEIRRSSQPLPEERRRSSQPVSEDRRRSSQPVSEDRRRSSQPVSEERRRSSEPESEERRRSSEPESGERRRSSQPVSDERRRSSQPVPEERRRSSQPVPEERRRSSQPVSEERRRSSQRSDKLLEFNDYFPYLRFVIEKERRMTQRNVATQTDKRRSILIEEQNQMNILNKEALKDNVDGAKSKDENKRRSSLKKNEFNKEELQRFDENDDKSKNIVVTNKKRRSVLEDEQYMKENKRDSLFSMRIDERDESFKNIVVTDRRRSSEEDDENKIRNKKELNDDDEEDVSSRKRRRTSSIEEIYGNKRELNGDPSNTEKLIKYDDNDTKAKDTATQYTDLSEKSLQSEKTQTRVETKDPENDTRLIVLDNIDKKLNLLIDTIKSLLGDLHTHGVSVPAAKPKTEKRSWRKRSSSIPKNAASVQCLGNIYENTNKNIPVDAADQSLNTDATNPRDSKCYSVYCTTRSNFCDKHANTNANHDKSVTCLSLGDSTSPNIAEGSQIVNRKVVSIDRILNEELDKSKQAKKDINDILDRELCSKGFRITLDLPTRDGTTNIQESKSQGFSEGLRHAMRGRRMTIAAVNTDPMSLLALLKVSTATINHLLSGQNIPDALMPRKYNSRCLIDKSTELSDRAGTDSNTVQREHCCELHDRDCDTCDRKHRQWKLYVTESLQNRIPYKEERSGPGIN